MATVGRRRSITASLGRADKTLSKSASTSALSVGSDGPSEGHDGRSDSSSTHHQRRLSGLFKRKKRAVDDGAQLERAAGPAADMALAGAASRNPSDDSLGLHVSVPSSLLTDDSDLDVESAA